MDISLMTIDDYEKVYKLWINTSGMGMRSLDDSFQGINKFIKRNPTTNFIAKIENEIVGVILCGNDGRRGYIYHTAVDYEYRGKGIGKALVKAALEALRKEDINKVALVAFVTNDIGNKFWQSILFPRKR